MALRTVEGVDWNLEISAISELNVKTEGCRPCCLTRSPANLQQVVWAVATRTDTEVDIDII